MGKVLVGSILGIAIGAALGALLAFIVHLCEPKEEAPTSWTSYANMATAPIQDGHPFAESSPRPLSTYLFFGILFGGGFGALVGAITGATVTVIRTIRETSSQSRQGFPSPGNAGK
jgi:hypothetical protein